MTSLLIPIADVTARDLDCWRELAGRALEPNPFFEPEFVLPAAAHLDTPGVGLLVAGAAKMLAAARRTVRGRRAA